MNNRTSCFFCSNQFMDLNASEDLKCYYCKEMHDINKKCIKGHYVCDSCYNSLLANDLIETYCINSNLKDPFEIAITLMKNPKIRMHGTEHHFLVPAVLLSFYYNIKNAYDDKEIKINQARKKVEKISSGSCESFDNCGAGIGTGIFISLITNTTSLSKYEFKLRNLMTAKSLFSIDSYGGPRCCKRNTFLAITEAVNFLNEIFGIKTQINKNIKCDFNPFNKYCIKNECSFYDRQI